MMKLSRTAERISHITTLVSDFFVQHLLFPILLSTAVGAGSWSLTHVNRLGSLLKNTVSKGGRIVCFRYILLTAVFMGAVYGFLYLRHKKRMGAMPDRNAILTWNRSFSFLFALPFLGNLLTYRIAEKEGIFCALSVVAVVAACIPTLLESVKALSRLLKRCRDSRDIDDAPFVIRVVQKKYLPEIITCALFVAYSFHLAQLSVNVLRALGTRMGDMSIYTNVLYHNLHGDWLGCSLVKAGTHASSHFDPILILFTPLFALYQRPEFLLWLQSIWFGLGIIPVFLLASRVLENKWAGVTIAAVYALHPNLHFANLCEFHSLALVGTPLLWGLYFLEAGHFLRFFAILPIALLVREDVSLLMCFVGITFILTNRKSAWVGAVTILVSLTYLFVVKKVFMTSDSLLMTGKSSANFMGYFKYMIPHRDGFKGMVISILTNPVFSLKYLFSVQKLELALRLLGPMLFLPIFAKKRLFMAAYGLVFIFLSSRTAVFSSYYHYQMILLPVLIYLTPYGIKYVLEKEPFGLEKPLLLTTALGALLISAVVGGMTIGTLSPMTILPRFVYTLSPRQEEEYEQAQKLVAMMEEDASVLASYSVAPFAALRENAYVLDFARPKEPTDYMLLDRERTRKDHLEKLDRQIKGKVYKVVAGRGGRLVLYKHVPNTQFIPDPDEEKDTESLKDMPKARGRQKILSKPIAAPDDLSGVENIFVFEDSSEFDDSEKTADTEKPVDSEKSEDLTGEYAPGEP